MSQMRLDFDLSSELVLNLMNKSQEGTSSQISVFLKLKLVIVPSGRWFSSQDHQVFLCVALSALDRANTNLLVQVVVGDSFGTSSVR